jgi:hypothetical protein
MPTCMLAQPASHALWCRAEPTPVGGRPEPILCVGLPVPYTLFTATGLEGRK